MSDHDFVDIEQFCPDILIDVRYASTDNFTHRVLYSEPRCLLRRGVAEKVKRVQASLVSEGIGLKIWDGYRPHSVQKILWEIVSDKRFVAPPDIGSKHNRGSAVDLTLVNDRGEELLMPTLFDDFTQKAFRSFMDLPKEAIHNRNRLEHAMKEEGFIPLPHEWWHFDDKDWQSYPIEDFSLDSALPGEL